MFKAFIAGLTAVSLGFTSPAQAEGISQDQVGKVLFGILATAAVVSIAKNRNDPAVVTEVHDSRTWAPRSHSPRYDRPRQESPRTVQPWGQRDRMTLPAQCYVSYDTRYGSVRMFGRDCMRQNYRFVARLPEACTVRAATREGPRNGWDPQCLRVAGYSVGRRR